MEGARWTMLLAGLLAAGCSTMPRFYEEEVEVRANLIGGYRAVDHEIFESHPVVGFELELARPRAPFGYEAGYLVGWEDEDVDGVEHEGSFHEAYLGLRKTWVARGGRAQPYVGAGAAWMKAVRDAEAGAHEADFDDRGGGGYVHAGVAWLVGNLAFDRETTVYLGFDVRGVIGDDMDYAQGALTLGFGH